MDGYAIFQSYHAQIFSELIYKYPMSNTPIFRLNFTPQWIGKRLGTPLKPNVWSLGKYVITEVVGQLWRFHAAHYDTTQAGAPSFT